MAINFISSTKSDELCAVNSKNNNIETIIFNKRDEVSQESFELLFSNR